MDEFQILRDAGILDPFVYTPPQPEPVEGEEPIIVEPITILGVPGFTLESVSYFGNSPSEAESQRIVVGFVSADVSLVGLDIGSQLSLSKGSVTYNFTISRFVDMLDGWTDAYLDFVNKT